MAISTEELMRQVRTIRVVTTRLVDEFLSGAYHSVFKGQGIEFDEVREYVVGDDIRSIDWNVTARMGHPFVKRFAEERELTVIFVVDVSGSQSFGSGTRSKAEVAAELTCLLALSAIKNQDNVGLILFSDRIEKYIPPRKGRTAVMRLVREVLAFGETRHGTNLAAALRFLSHVQKRKAIVFLISDFQDSGFLPSLRVMAQRYDVIACPISDPREVELAPCGLLEIEDPETGDRLLLDTRSPRVRRAFQQKAAEERENLREEFRKRRLDTIPLSTDRPFINEVRQLFRARERRAQRG